MALRWCALLIILFASEPNSAGASQVLCGGAFAKYGTIESHDSLWDFDFISKSVSGRIIDVKSVPVKNIHKLSDLNDIAPGEWMKVYAVLSDGREIHYFEHVDLGIVADAKWR